MPQYNPGQLQRLKQFQKKRGRILQRYSRSGKRLHSKYLKQFNKHALVGDQIRINENPTWIEKFVEVYLSKYYIKYVKEYEIMGRFFDFYLPELNLIIECHGDYWHGNPKIYNREEGGRKTNLKIVSNRINDIFKRCVIKSKDGNLRMLVLWESSMTEENIQKGLDYFRNLPLDEEWHYLEI